MEAVRKDVDLIISYHPPIFASMKRITQRYLISFFNILKTKEKNCLFMSAAPGRNELFQSYLKIRLRYTLPTPLGIQYEMV